MGLPDVTSRDAVLDAIDEYEDLGAQEFLDRYGAGLGSQMTIEYVGRRFPALATLSLAHQVQCGALLTPDEVDESAAAERLVALGFRVLGAPDVSRRTARSTTAPAGTATPRKAATRSRAAGTTQPSEAISRITSLAWPLEPGDARTRQELAGSIGSSKHAVIDVSARTRSVVVFSSPAAALGVAGWTADGSAYRVVGDGRRGDQSWTDANLTLLQHGERGLAVRLFEEREEPWRPGGRRFTYVGEFRLDPEAPWAHDRVPGADEKDRSVLVFRLVPVDRDAAEPADATDGTTGEQR